jgi:hypothetical protein
MLRHGSNLCAEVRTWQGPAMGRWSSMKRDDSLLSRVGGRVRSGIGLLGALLLLAGCTSTRFDVTAPATDARTYGSVYPYYAEFCALSEFNKLPGSAVDIDSGGPGGHSVLYLNGVCKVKDAGYPVIQLCDGNPSPDQGVGLSVNAHYRNANWIATEGRDFFFHGDLAPGEPLTHAAYSRTPARAKAIGILDGIQFQESVMKDQPPAMSGRDFMYELSAATDYAIAFGRDRYCARVPIDRERMGGVVDYLNGVNAPYRRGERRFEWDVLRNNCAHLAHNALATVGIWQVWPTERTMLEAAFDFPVPKNEFVNLMRRTNDLPIGDPAALYDDPALRGALLQLDWIATRPGALAEAERAILANAMYDTDLRLIFYDDPIFGQYQRHFEAIFSDPRYTDLRANLTHFAAQYDRILASHPGPASSASEAAFDALYYDHIARERAALEIVRAKMSRITG